MLRQRSTSVHRPDASQPYLVRNQLFHDLGQAGSVQLWVERVVLGELNESVDLTTAAQEWG